MEQAIDRLSMLQRFSSGNASAMEVRGLLGEITYGELLIEMGAAGLPLPVPSRADREPVVAKLRAILFPTS